MYIYDRFVIAPEEFLADPGMRDEDQIDESKQFFELVQQYMAEYTASAKVIK